MKRIIHLRFLPLLPTLATAILVNRTIDDKYGDSVTGVVPTYAPDSYWTDGSLCYTCNVYPSGGPKNGGGAQADVSQMFNGTWHDSTYHAVGPIQTITMSFVGQAVYVFHLIANELKWTTTVTNLSFIIDGEEVGHFDHNPDPAAPQFLYRVPVYVNSSLSHANHTLTIRPRGAPDMSLILFDYVAYTADEPASPAPLDGASSSPASPFIPTPSASMQLPGPLPSTSGTPAPRLKSHVKFIGGLAGGLALLGVILATLALAYLRRKCSPRTRDATRQADTSLTAHGAADTRFSGTRRASTLPGFSDVDSTLPPPYRSRRTTCDSADLSCAATWPDSRFARSLSDTPKGGPLSSTERHAARVRLFEKLTAAPGSERRQVTTDRQVPDRPRVEQDRGDAPPGSTSSPPVRGLVANLHAEAAWRRMLDAELTMHGFSVEQAPPYYQGGPGADTIPWS
ncbi:uncharacterized protein TRAVEDRAFT_41348 [Trametes versicolor FP-101664 SS1]|uniref:uncharacterized protein n=1 Tax=Trametes versicolor (strain FP-101664) TaxID=717944 RepID=UPI00046234D4|nr:uncharacterized protein TRAVEDRAFT_41348 [Trametes versicolor FP-101664 SS1]EIW63923.1 hypothetical protein TRAVEDRAFT_41348 [Trametes versicolor FP-101664 SS1]